MRLRAQGSIGSDSESLADRRCAARKGLRSGQAAAAGALQFEQFECALATGHDQWRRRCADDLAGPAGGTGAHHGAPELQRLAAIDERRTGERIERPYPALQRPRAVTPVERCFALLDLGGVAYAHGWLRLREQTLRQAFERLDDRSRSKVGQA